MAVLAIQPVLMVASGPAMWKAFGACPEVSMPPVWVADWQYSHNMSQLAWS